MSRRTGPLLAVVAAVIALMAMGMDMLRPPEPESTTLTPSYDPVNAGGCMVFFD